MFCTFLIWMFDFLSLFRVSLGVCRTLLGLDNVNGKALEEVIVQSIHTLGLDQLKISDNFDPSP